MDRELKQQTEIHEQNSATNDDVQPRSAEASVHNDLKVRIYRPSRSATTSGIARTKHWLLVFEPRSAPFIEPLMGWTGSRDPLTQVELPFPTREAAVAYAERQGLRYIVQTIPRRLPTCRTSQRRQASRRSRKR